MKRTRNRSLIVFIMAFAFVVGMCTFCFRLFTQNDDWVQKPFNGHTSGNGGLAKAGAIYDRSGNVLAETVDGVRMYNSDYATRCALLHLIGDNSLNISTAIQSLYRTELTGYNYIWGMGLPTSLQSGRDINLTIDSSACAAAYNALGDRTGACVVFNYKTGELLCSVSTKTYDPQNPPEITEENEEQYDGVYLDHTMASTFTPGSIFKLVTSAAAIEYMPEIFDKEIYCDGSEEIGGSEITCTEAHGTVGLYQALSSSCNVFFAETATELGADKLQATAEKMGFNMNFKVSDITAAASTIDLSSADTNGLAWAGVGQYTDLANPMHMAIMCSAIANGGTPVIPYVIDKSGFLSSNSISYGEQMLSTTTADTLKDMMRYAVTDHYGESMFAGLTAYAKTGTAEVGEGEPNAWMVGFTSDEDNPYAFAVVVEHGGYGISAAGSVLTSVLSELAY